MSHIHIVIPVYNQWKLTEACLNTLSDSLNSPSNSTYSFTITVSDDGSTGKTTTQLIKTGKKLFKDAFAVTRSNRNKGFAAACNAGAKHFPHALLKAATIEKQIHKPVCPDFIFFMDNDLQISPNWLTPLLQKMHANPTLGAVSPLLLYPDSGRVQHCGYAFSPSLRHVHLFANLPATHSALTHSRNLQAISASAMLIRYDLFNSCNGFHEGFNNGLEDIDLCARIREKSYHVAIATDCHLFHAAQQTVKHITEKNNGNATVRELNTLLLNERTKGVFGPDLHTFATQANMEIAITPWLESFLKLNRETEQALTLPFLKSFSPTKCWEQLQKEPLWFTGYELLCGYLAEQKMYAECCGARLLQSSHFPMIPVYTALQEAAEQSGNSDVAEQSRIKMEHVLALLEEPSKLIKKAAGMVNWAKKAGEPAIEELFTNWLKEIGVL